MKSTIVALLVASLFTTPLIAQRPAPGSMTNEPVSRVTFTLRNTLGYHRMFLAEGPGMAYGFTMSRNESTPKNWPVGSRLYFSNDGETKGALILTVTANDAGETLTTGNEPVRHRSADKPLPNGVTFTMHNTSFLPRRIALVSYVPGETGNGTAIFTMGPKGNKHVSFPAGTRLYLATTDQVDVVMNGKRIDNDKPFLIVKKEDARKVFDVN
ncbi:MAG TPA: hypothetical protein VGA96_01655 [Fibrella sp.]